MNNIQENPQKIQSDNEAFEARCDRRYRNYVNANRGRRWRCRECGEAYGPEHIYYSFDCDECGGALVEEARNA